MTKLKILVIEDDIVHRTVLENILESENYEVHSAADGEEGIKMALELIPDLIITDIRMPGKNGYEVCEILSNNPKTKYIPIVILTAHHDDEHILQGFKLGAFDYILKPFDSSQLMARINAAAKFKILRDELIDLKQKTVLFEISGAAAHELNQPLTVLKSSIYLLKEKIKKEAPTEEMIEKYLNKMDNSITRMSEIILQMQELREYKTKDYAMGGKIINFEGEK